MIHLLTPAAVGVSPVEQLGLFRMLRIRRECGGFEASIVETFRLGRRNSTEFTRPPGAAAARRTGGGQFAAAQADTFPEYGQSSLLPSWQNIVAIDFFKERHLRHSFQFLDAGSCDSPQRREISPLPIGVMCGGARDAWG
ncbi:hypothetical protein AB3X94_09010 [Paraburkholderia sp. BR10923]|uniref:hypothetical protein n=1 Tax=Paraburkholderia sp. BR10923 TaxID=3236992 RepID=UPI0034CEA105